MSKKNKPSDINTVNKTIVTPQIATEITENNQVENLKYNVHIDANNIKLPGEMWGSHTNYLEKTLFTHIRGVPNDKCIMFTTPNIAKVPYLLDEMSLSSSINQLKSLTA
ncbi:PREDICTED: uncharacterized protein LOC107162183 [Diuraphis noxia]|uniref:uncharacterized protein LOC107162183 n=1 Tax=Diuraphis noxia TaxID=143948 RepID=UPI0007636FE8|nr:PREDICTED: uncharacterized protein LOC107162183 [Diuraphis noxia]XP_015364456.1 PREDICTED: uncharacterized protein LOC107162183 [Diuraphis noxia]